jgi:hypothetical protein
MAITTAAGISVTTVTNETGAGLDNASQLAPLGFQLAVPTANDGNETWTYVKASGALAAGQICQVIDGAAQYEVAVVPSNTLTTKARCVGVAQHAIGDNGFGFIMTKGRGSILSGSGGAIGANVAVVAGAPGGAPPAGGRGITLAPSTTTASCIVAWSSVVAGGANAAATGCWIDCGGT